MKDNLIDISDGLFRFPCETKVKTYMLGVVLFTDFTFKMYALYITEYGMDLRSLSLRLKTK